MAAACPFVIAVLRPSCSRSSSRVAFKRRARAAAPASAARTDPGAVVESTGGRVERFKLSREDVRVDYERQLTYANGSTKLMDVTVITDERGGGRSFTVTGKEGQVGQNESTLDAERRRAARGLATA